jgi:predicted transcriptional regulator
MESLPQLLNRIAAEHLERKENYIRKLEIIAEAAKAVVNCQNEQEILELKKALENLDEAA